MEDDFPEELFDPGISYSKGTDEQKTFCTNTEGVVRQKDLSNDNPGDFYCKVANKEVRVIAGKCRERSGCDFSL
jgi:hypothetical protein